MRFLALILLSASFSQPVIAQETDSYRWFNGSRGWCVEVEHLRLCPPFDMDVESILPGSVSFVQKVPDDVVPNRFLFIHDEKAGYSEIADSNDEVELVESFAIPGAIAKKYLVGSSYVLEVELENGVRIILFGKMDELVDIANVLSSSWE